MIFRHTVFFENFLPNTHSTDLKFGMLDTVYN